MSCTYYFILTYTRLACPRVHGRTKPRFAKWILFAISPIFKLLDAPMTHMGLKDVTFFLGYVHWFFNSTNGKAECIVVTEFILTTTIKRPWRQSIHTIHISKYKIGIDNVISLVSKHTILIDYHAISVYCCDNILFEITLVLSTFIGFIGFYKYFYFTDG